MSLLSSTRVLGTLIVDNTVIAPTFIGSLTGTASGNLTSSFTGSSNIITVGTIGAGTWQGGIISSTYGGTGVNNGARTLTINSNNFTVDSTGAARTLTLAGNLTTQNNAVTINAASAARTLTLNRSFTFSGDADRTLTINNNNKTIAGAATVLTFGGNFTHTGAHPLGITTTAETSVTLPSGTVTLMANPSLTKIVAPASTTSSASIRLPHGTAPTSGGEHGDMWTTTTTINVNLNGTTRELAAMTFNSTTGVLSIS
jgi:hypothetical protein